MFNYKFKKVTRKVTQNFRLDMSPRVHTSSAQISEVRLRKDQYAYLRERKKEKKTLLFAMRCLVIGQMYLRNTSDPTRDYHAIHMRGRNGLSTQRDRLSGKLQSDNESSAFRLTMQEN